MALMTSNATQVQGTNDSSIVSKLSMVKAGYVKDEYLKNFVKKPQKRSPFINRGYYARWKAVQYVVHKFFCGIAGSKQIVSLGAGFDTTYFTTKEHFSSDEVLFVEIDYPSVIERKVAIVNANKMLNKIECMFHNASSAVYRSGNYLAIGFDLRAIGSELHKLLCQNGVLPLLPTLFMSEVVLTYLTGSQSSKVLRWINHNYCNAFTLVFEQMLPNDGFGHVMCRHFENIGSPLLSIHDFPTLKDQEHRHNQLGFSHYSSTDLYSFYNSLSAEERHRVNELEVFDEYEGWHQMCLHYFVLCSTNSKTSLLTKSCQTMFDVCNKDLTSLQSLSSCRCSTLPYGEVCFIKMCSKPLHVFNHCMCLIEDDTKAIIIGGFGVPYLFTEDNKQKAHRRLSTMYKLDLKTYHLEEISFTHGQISHSMCSSLAKFASTEGKDMLLMFGGRTSPYCTTNSVRCIQLNEVREENGLQRWTACYDKIALQNNDEPPARWRHTVTLIETCEVFSNPAVIITGGRDKIDVFSDIWKLDLTGMKWQKYQVTTTDYVGSTKIRFQSRHSHSAVFWKSRNSLILSGGVNKDMEPLDEIVSLQFTSNCTVSAQRLSITPSLPARYSHTSHMVRDNVLLLVGGVTFPSPLGEKMPDNIAVINLDNTTCFKIVTFPPTFCNIPLRVHGHTSAVEHDSTEDEIKLHIIGGGSNCFSFGTSFNCTPFLVKFPIGK